MRHQATSNDQSSSSIDFFVAALRDPHNLRYCGRCLSGCLDSFFDKRSRITLNGRKLAGDKLNQRKDFWDSLIIFITTKRTEKQMQRLLMRLSQCNCPSNDRAVLHFHEVGKKIEPTSLRRNDLGRVAAQESTVPFAASRYVFIIDVFCALVMGLGSTSVRSVAKGLSIWPSSPDDLMPFGPDDLVKNLLQWYRVVPDAVVFHAGGLFLRVCRFLLVPSLASRQFCKTVVDAGRALFDRTMEGLSSDELSRRKETEEVFNFQAQDIQAFLDVVWEEGTDIQVHLTRGTETKLLQVCSLLVHASTDPRMPSPSSISLSYMSLPGLCQVGTQIYRLYHMHLYPRPSIPLHPSFVRVDNRSFPPPASIRSLRESTILGIQDLRKETRCSAFGCENTLQSVGRSYQRCSRCNIVSYCGRECQVRAWRDEKYPHKRVCSLLKTLIEKGGGVDAFSPKIVSSDSSGMAVVSQIFCVPAVLEKWKKAGVEDSDVQYVSDWEKELGKEKYNLPDGTEWTPGFEDYDVVALKFGADGKGPKSIYPNRLARWPSEVAKEKAFLEVQPFWEQEIDGV